MHNIMVSGIGTGVGKTIVSTILTILFDGDYWKPIQCGNKENSDTVQVKKWLNPSRHVIHPPAYSFKAPLSPHHAARLEKISINLKKVFPPTTDRSLIIEGVGGILVPVTTQCVSLELFKSWNCKWILVSNHYLGSINHTLLTLEVLKQHQIPLLGIIFNGPPNPDSESAVLAISKVPFLGRLLKEPYVTKTTLQKYVKQWQPHFSKILL
ncbi:dethiobiotin synthase [Criblamydia sequanensis]|uniref:ATP-dependent dethiobiotin synthetase BioD n=1 Tax=Candidatus Criblamydia sequanensis CRIB-18 TaxID=1437425 RepID=A0A090D324_9BACT|nr:dethiobiotin synthase [Criblamydia sequanensis]CDR34858.1 Dethiobiotin synthase [Criblamydia sequanensis CRIB-18]